MLIFMNLVAPNSKCRAITVLGEVLFYSRLYCIDRKAQQFRIDLDRRTPVKELYYCSLPNERRTVNPAPALQTNSCQLT